MAVIKGIDITSNPFFLSDEACDWVRNTFENMNLEEKAGQVFCPMGFNADGRFLSHLIKDLHVGAMMYRPDTAENIQLAHRMIQDMADIPLLLAANTESGGNGLAIEGTSFGRPMAVAATGDSENAYHMGYTACAEGAALGLNWSFAPIIDIDREFHNPITNVRTFGSDPAKVLEYARRYNEGANENNVAMCIKHFPGDGVDERDQHILTSVNSLSCEEWDKSYGMVYKTLIDEGAKTVMVGHIAQPAYAKKLAPDAGREVWMLPASVSEPIISGLLRGRLGFNGLVSTDATPMVGFTAAMPRSRAVPTAIEAGADMILFNKDIDEDVKFLLDGINSGILSMERLDEAVIRILATKASLGLHIKKKEGTLVPEADAIRIVGAEKHREWAKTVAEKSITLVQDRNRILPVTPERYGRVYLNVIQREMSPDDPYVQRWKELFEQEGFEVTVRDRTTRITVNDMMDAEHMSDEKKTLMHEMYRSIGEMKDSYDLYVYIANMENASNNTTLRLNWNVAFGLGDDAPWMASEIPVMMISTAYPYHLFDAPMIGTYINAYSGDPEFCRAVMERITGRAEFTGISPVDPYCGKDYLK